MKDFNHCDKIKKQILIEGTPASPGIACGKLVFIPSDKNFAQNSCYPFTNNFSDNYVDNTLLISSKMPAQTINSEYELQKFDTTLSESQQQLLFLQQKSLAEDQHLQADIIELQLMILADKDLNDSVKILINNFNYNCTSAIEKIYKAQIKRFEELKDNRARSKSQDIKDILNRLLANLQSSPPLPSYEIEEGAIIAAKNISPSQFISIPHKKIAGLICEQGETNSHLAILAASMEIPAIFKCNSLFSNQNDIQGAFTYLDADNGKAYVNPDENTKKLIETAKEKIQVQKDCYESNRYQPSLTADNIKLEIQANVLQSEQIDQLENINYDGIGLLRTETLFLKPEDLLDEKVQFESYSHISRKTEGKTIIFRTFDLAVSETFENTSKITDIRESLIPLRSEPPDLRGLARSLRNEEEFIKQLKAILKVAANSNIAVLFPMVLSINQFMKGKNFLYIAQQELLKESNRFIEVPKTGAMIETPMKIEKLKKIIEAADFISIGSNDLSYYSGESIFSRSNLNLISQIVSIAQLHNNKKVILCGEAAALSHALPLWVGLGIRSFSVSIHNLLPMKHTASLISRHTVEKAVELYKEYTDPNKLSAALRDLIK